MSSTNITNEVFINNIINNEFVEITEQLRVINSNNPAVLVNQTGDKDFLDIKNNNNNILKIINNGNVGIGTINPNKKLDVNGDINLLGNIYLNNEIINTTNIIEGSNLYYTDERVDSNILNKNLVSFNSIPDNNSILYYNNNNWLNLKFDTDTLEITSNNELKAINSINGIDDSSTTILEISKHIIPETNSIYDIGSAEKKIRHLFLSDNSLWIGDENKISITEGKMKIRKRKRNIIPSKLLELDPTINETKLLEIINTNELIQKQTLNELTLNDWEKYLKIKYPQNNLFVTDLFESTTDYDLDATTDAWIESMNKNIIINNYYNNIGIGVENPNKKIDINGDINLTGSIYVNYEQISTNDIVEGENKYYTEDRVNSNIASKNLININNIPNDKDILYYKDGNWTNLKLDQNSLEISNDHKLKIIDNLLNKIQSLEDRIISLESK